MKGRPRQRYYENKTTKQPGPKVKPEQDAAATRLAAIGSPNKSMLAHAIMMPIVRILLCLDVGQHNLRPLADARNDAQ